MACDYGVPGNAAVLIATAATILLTGALHEDGLADVFDGIGGGRTPERALEIMKDSSIGAYGAVALGLVLAMKVVSLSGLPAAVAVGAMIAAHAVSRLASVG